MTTVRRKTALLIRLVCTLALLVAGLPVRASEVMPCAAPVVAAAKKANCDMPCCKPEAVTECRPAPVAAHDCCMSHQGMRPTLSAKGDPCGCEISSIPGAPAPMEKVAPAPGFDVPILALPAPTFSLTVAAAEFAEPGIFGVDSGPPPASAFLPDLGRAPPVARA